MYLENLDVFLELEILIAKKLVDLELDELVDKLKDVLSNVWKESTRSALIETITALQKLSGPVTADEMEMIDNMVASIMGMDLDAATKKNLVDILREACSGARQHG